MASTNVCPTEDAIGVFLEHLVSPLLPQKTIVRENPTASQQQAVAKKVHSVVLLYNYYHRRQHPELLHFPFDEFCQFAVIVKPTLLEYMKFMNQQETELLDVDEQLSVVEKVIMEACDICMCLDASKNVPNIEGWPIAKVAVLLIDCKKEKCIFLSDSITKGVWSVIEKDVDLSSQCYEDTKVAKYALKKRRVLRKQTKEKSNVDEAGLLQFAYSAVKEAVGIDQTDVMLLESHTVYSHSKEKTSSLFFIMQCNHLIDQNVIQVPIKDVIDSLQGPLIQKSSGSWTVTPAVEYFNLLPYSKTISEWFSRGTVPESLQGSRMAEKTLMKGSPEMTEPSAIEDVSIDLDREPNNTELLKREENNQNGDDMISYCHGEIQNMDVDTCAPVSFQETENFTDIVPFCEHQDTKDSSLQNFSEGSASSPKAINLPTQVVTTTTLFTEEETKNHDHATCNKLLTKTLSIEDANDKRALVTSQPTSNNVDIERLQNIFALKGERLSQTSLKFLTEGRDKLTLQLRKIEDEIAQFNKKIQTILTGGEGALELMIECMMEVFNVLTSQNHEGHSSIPCAKRRRLSEAVLSKSPCQELDDICRENIWLAPAYHVSPLDGGFEANVTVKGEDFECSCGGNLCLNPQEARESAATQMLAKLRSMVKSAQN